MQKEFFSSPQYSFMREIAFPPGVHIKLHLYLLSSSHDHIFPHPRPPVSVSFFSGDE